MEHIDKLSKQEEPTPQVEVKSHKKKMYLLVYLERK